MLQKRKDGVRIDLGLEVRITDTKNLSRMANGVVQDISMGGIKAVCDTPFQVRNKVVLELKLSQGLMPLIIEAQVIRIEPIFFKHGRKYLLAVKFCKLSPEAIERIKNQLVSTSAMVRDTIEKYREKFKGSE